MLGVEIRAVLKLRRESALAPATGWASGPKPNFALGTGLSPLLHLPMKCDPLPRQHNKPTDQTTRDGLQDAILADETTGEPPPTRDVNRDSGT